MGRNNRNRKGLFGISQKKSILFTFNPRKGDECSSDSEDSDYYPGRRSTDEDDDAAMITKAKQKMKKKEALKRKAGKAEAKDAKRTRSSKSLEKNKLQTIANGKPKGPLPHLPPEILLNIFRFCVELEGIRKFISRASRVNREWHRLSRDATLYKTIDLSAETTELTRKKLTSLLDLDLSQCKHLSFANQTKVGPKEIERVLENTQRLTALDLYGCQGMRPELLKSLPSLCPLLAKLDLSSAPSHLHMFNFPCLEIFFKAAGLNLKEIRLTNCAGVHKHIKSFLKLMESNCPNLEALDVSFSAMQPSLATQGVEVDMQGFLDGCPKLKELRFDGYNFIDKSGMTDPYRGLSHLKRYSQANQVHDLSEKPTFNRMFGQVSSLEELNLSRSRLNPDLLANTVKSVRHLYLSNMKFGSIGSVNIVNCVAAWQPSIETLDLSGNPIGQLMELVLTEILPPDSQPDNTRLRKLFLAQSPVSISGVAYILKKCANLELLDLTSCRDLPRGCKRIFYKKDFRMLLKLLSPENSPASACESSDYSDSDF